MHHNISDYEPMYVFSALVLPSLSKYNRRQSLRLNWGLRLFVSAPLLLSTLSLSTFP